MQQLSKNSRALDMTSDSVHLSDVANIQGGFAFKSSDFQSEGVAVVKIANIQPPFVSLSNVDRVANEKLTTLDRFRLNDGDILMAMTGATVGKVGRFKETEPAYLNQRVARINAKRGPQFDDFIYAIVSQPRFDELIEGASAGSAQANISAAGIGSVLIPHISDADQLVIGETARSIDDRITLLRETNKTLEAIAQALFKSWFVDFDPVRAKAEGGLPEGIDAATAALFPDAFDETELGLAPKGWSVNSLSTFITESTLRIGNKPAVVLSAVQTGSLVMSSKFFTKRVHSKDISKYKAVQPHSYAYNPSRINIGSIGINETGGVGAVSSMYIVFNPKDINFGYYLWHLLKTKRICESIKTMSSGTVRQSLAFKDLASIKVVLPPVEIIQKFFEIRNEIYKNITAKENQILLLTNLRDILFPHLISGQLRIAEAEAEIEKVSA